jgi:2-keto-3-deoxy-L-rhamnonate aldolase RhmA
VLSAVERIGKACVAADVPYGTHAQSSQRASELLAAGALLLTLGSDVMLLETGSYRVLGEMASLRDGLAQPPTNESGPTRTGVVGP